MQNIICENFEVSSFKNKNKNLKFYLRKNPKSRETTEKHSKTHRKGKLGIPIFNYT